MSYNTPDVGSLEPEDKWIISEYNSLVREVRDNIDRYELGVALSKLYDFIWDKFCDWYIELVKVRLFEGGDGGDIAKSTLVYVMSGALKLLHPYMPFLTEQIWRSLPHEDCDSIMISCYPEYNEDHSFPEAESGMRAVIELITAIRNRRAEMNVAPSRKAKIFINSADPLLFSGKEKFFIKLAGASEVELLGCPPENSVKIITEKAEVSIPLSDIIDADAERERLTRELAKSKEELQRAENKLSNTEFTEKAPQKVVDAEKEKVIKYKSVIEKLEEALSDL